MGTWKIEVVSSRGELDAIADLLLDASDGSRQLFFPIHNDDRDTALRSAQQRLWDEHYDDPSSTWIYIRDPATVSRNDNAPPHLIGVCQWRIYQCNPFEGGLPQLDAVWWPQGGGRQFTNRYMQQIFVPRSILMARPHSGMSWIAVVPEYRRKGVGTALMNWGIQQTDKLGLESYIEGTVLGASLYKSCGYKLVKYFDFRMRKEDGDEVYKDLEHRLERKELPPGFAAMWRPPYGTFEEDEPQKTWNQRLERLNT